MRSCKYFKNIFALKLLYCALIRSQQLKYIATVRALYQIKYCAIIEKIQYCFLRRVNFLMANPMYYNLTIHISC